MKKLFFILMALCGVISSSCTTGNTAQITVASEQGDCVGVGPQKCLLIKERGDTNWQYLYSNIEGFNYESGYEYVLEIRKEEIKNPAADQSSIRYVLVKEVSKERKNSTDLPTVIEMETSPDTLMIG